MQRELVEIVVSLAYFLDSSDDTIIDPDAAVEMLEYITGNLQQLDADDRREFLAIVDELAADAESQGESQETINFLRGFGETTGLNDEE